MKIKDHINFLAKESPFAFSSPEWKHLQSCAGCQKEEKPLRELFEALDKTPLPQKSDRFWDEQVLAIGERIHQEEAYGRRSWNPLNWLPAVHHPFSATFASLLILLVLAAGFYLTVPQNPGENPVVALSFDVDEEALPWDRFEDTTVSLNRQAVLQLAQNTLTESLTAKDSPGLDYALDDQSVDLSDFQSSAYN